MAAVRWASSEIAKIPLDLLMSSNTHQREEIVLDGEDEPQAQADASFPDAASMELPDSKAGMEMGLSQGSGER
jgi:hypothetical protein